MPAHRAGQSGLGDDLGLPSDALRAGVQEVQGGTLDPQPAKLRLQQAGEAAVQRLRLLHGGRAHQHGPPGIQGLHQQLLQASQVALGCGGRGERLGAGLIISTGASEGRRTQRRARQRPRSTSSLPPHRPRHTSVPM